MLNIVSIIAGLIADVPEAIDLWNKVAPLVATHVTVPSDMVNEINTLTPIAHQAVADKKAS